MVGPGGFFILYFHVLLSLFKGVHHVSVRTTAESLNFGSGKPYLYEERMFGTPPATDSSSSQ